MAWAELVAVLALAALARLPGLFVHATIPDEAFTFFIAAHPLPAIVTLLRSGDFHPPLLYLIGHALFWLSPRAYLFRVVGAAFGIAGAAASCGLARRIVPRFAFLAGLLVALNPGLVFYDGFFRMYAMLWSLCAMSWLALAWALDEPRSGGRWVVFCVSAVALLYTHYLAFFTLAGQLVYVAVAQPRARGFWISCAIAALAFVPWLPVFIAQYPLGGTAYRALQGHLFQLVYAPSVLLIDGLPLSLLLNGFVVAGLWLAIAAGIAVAVSRRAWLAVALCLPVALQVAYSLLTGKLLFGQRYLLQAVPAMAILICLSCSWLAGVRLRAAAFALGTTLAVMAAAGTLDKHFLAEYMPIDWTAYGRFLDARLQPGDAVVFDGSMTYYVLVGTKAADAGRPRLLVTNAAEATLFGERAARMGRVWYIGYQSELPDPDRLAFAAIARTHPHHVTWRSSAAAYGDVVLTTLFLPAAEKRGP